MLNTNIFQILTPIITAIMSGIISYLVAKAKIKSELDKLKLSYIREDKTEFETAYADVLSKSNTYYAFLSRENFNSTITAISKLLSIAPIEYQELLKQLDSAITNSNTSKINEIRYELIDLHSRKP